MGSGAASKDHPSLGGEALFYRDRHRFLRGGGPGGQPLGPSGGRFDVAPSGAAGGRAGRKTRGAALGRASRGKGAATAGQPFGGADGGRVDGAVSRRGLGQKADPKNAGGLARDENRRVLFTRAIGPDRGRTRTGSRQGDRPLS